MVVFVVGGGQRWRGHRGDSQSTGGGEHFPAIHGVPLMA
jgi:hypothetical protein